MAYVYQHSDRVGRTRLAPKHDICILECRANAQDAASSKLVQYARSEIYRMAEVAKPYIDKAYVARCEQIKQNLSGNNKDFEATAKQIVDAFVVEAALNCRIDKGHVEYQNLTKYMKFIFDTVYGKLR